MEAERSAEYIEANEYDNLTCTLCDRYLIKNQKIQDLEDEVGANESMSVAKTFTLKDALSGFANDKDSESIGNVMEDGEARDMNDSGENAASLEAEGLSQQASQNYKLEVLLSNNKLVRNRMDEVTVECKRISNNLKLYLIVNVLKSDVAGDLTASTEDRNSVEAADEVKMKKTKKSFHQHKQAWCGFATSPNLPRFFTSFFVNYEVIGP